MEEPIDPKLHEDLNKAIRAHHFDTMKAELQSLEKAQSLQVRKSVWRNYFAIAASVLVIISLAWWYLLSSAQATPQALFAEHFEPMDNIIYPITRDLIPNQDTPIEKYAYQAYEQGKYASAIQLFESIPTTNRTLNQILYTNIAQMATGQYQPAITSLKQLANESDYEFQANAQWYLALAYLRDEQLEKSKTILIQISQTPNHPYMTEAKELLSKI